MKTILVIDDDENLRTDLLEILDLEGYTPLGAEDGHQGILFAQKHQPDLIICDITMPRLDGFAVLQALCQDARTSQIPVIFLSGLKDRATVKRGLQLGAVAHLPKPYDLADLLTTLREQLGD